MAFSYDHNKSLGHLTGLASRLFNNLLGKRLQEAGIDMTPEQWGAVLVLLNHGAMTQSELGERLFLEKSSVSRLVNRLEQRGLIVRGKDDHDSRLKLVSTTPKALATAERSAAIARKALDEAQRGMSREERKLCRLLLVRVIDNLHQATKGG